MIPISAFAVVDETVSGVIQSVDNETVVINEESYLYDEALREQLQSRLGGSCTAYMDVDETIIWLSGVQTTDMQYGYLIQGVSQKSGIENVVQLRLLTENNSIEILDLDSKVQINGERYTSAAAISTAVGLLAPVGHMGAAADSIQDKYGRQNYRLEYGNGQSGSGAPAG